MTSDRFAGKTVLITGAGGGLGRVLAARFSAEGARTVLAGRRREPLEETAGVAGGESLVVQADVTDEAQVVAMVAAAVERFGGVDVLVNNAAQPGQDRWIWEQTLDNWNATIAIDVTAAMLCTREALAQSMLERRAGSILNISSTAGWNGVVRKTHYSVAKAALRTLTKVCASEVGPHGVRVNCLVPGTIDTDLLRSWFDRMASEQSTTAEKLRSRAESSVALRRISSPDDVAGVAMFLCSDDAASITGQSVVVDGGGVMSG